MGVYTLEQFTDEEAAVLRPYFTNLDQPVFALVNLPEVVKGALFARYSRTHKSLRRLFLDEFVADLDLTGDLTVDATVGLRRAEELYDRVFFEYGDDSVAQLGGVHLACEQASNLLTKILEWGRLMAYLEQSTRYIPYDAKLGGRYRYYRDSAVLADRDLAWRYIADMDALFETYSEMLPTLVDWARERYPKDPADSHFVYKQTIKAKACDAGRGSFRPPRCRTSASTAPVRHSNRCSCACARTRSRKRGATRPPCSKSCARSFRRSLRVDREDRGVLWSAYLAETRASTAELVGRLFDGEEAEPRPFVTLTDFDPHAEDKLLGAICYPQTNLPDDQVMARVRTLTDGERAELLRAYVGERRNRRHRPGARSNASTTGSTCSPTTARSAISSATGC